MLVWLTLACTWIDAEHEAWRLDPDADGVGWAEDCDNADPAVNDPVATYADADGDGHGAGEPTFACPGEGEGVATADDCDDTDADAFPGNPERCDGLDQDCDGTADDGLSPQTPYYADADGDGAGAGLEVGTACAAPPGTSFTGGDCDDADATAFPGAEEIGCDGVDQDCADGDAGTSVPGSYGTLQNAINAAPAGAWLCVTPGTWRERIQVNQAVHLRGESSATTVIDAMGAGPALETRGALDLWGFTLQNGTTGLWVDPGASARLHDVVLQDNHCTSGCTGVGLLAQGDVEAEDLVVRDNTATGSEGYASGVGIAQFSGVFSANGLEVSGNRFTGERSAVSGVGAWFSGTSATLRDAQFVDNTAVTTEAAADGGAIYSITDLSLADAELRGNTLSVTATALGYLPVHGAAIEQTSGSLSLVEVTIAENGADVVANEGANVYVMPAVWANAATTTLHGVRVEGNWVKLTGDGTGVGALWGAGLSVYQGTVDAADVAFVDNTVDTVAQGSAFGGAGVWFVDGTVDGVQVSGTRVTAEEGTADVLGLGLGGQTTGLVASHLELTDNVADGLAEATGGSVLQLWAPATVSNVRVVGNTFAEAADGYAVSLLGATLENADVVDNVGVWGLGLTGAGDGPAEVHDSSVVGQARGAARQGGSMAPVLAYCNFFDDGASPFSGLADPTGQGGNLAVDPGYVDRAADLHLAAGSPLVDAGDPARTDADGSRADIGSYGGPGGAW